MRKLKVYATNTELTLGYAVFVVAQFITPLT